MVRKICLVFLCGVVSAAAQVSVLGVEVTQSIQALDNSVPLVSGKATLVRVYMQGAPENSYVTGRLTISGAGQVTSLSAGRVALTKNADIEDLRVDIRRSLNFALPKAWSAGQITVQKLDIQDTSGAAVTCTGCDVNKVFTFTQVPPLRIRLVGLAYRVPGTNVIAVPRKLDFDAAESWLSRAYPIARLLSTRTILDASDLGLLPRDLECHNVNLALTQIRANEVRSGVDNRTHYYALVPDDGGFMVGCASGIPQSPDPSVVASGPSGIPRPSFAAWDSNEGSYSGFYAGHELAHTFGRYHPGFCQNQSADDGAYPFHSGLLTGIDPRSGVDLHYTGLDFGPAGNQPVALPGPKWTDVMTYCDYEWTSHYTYTALMARLQSEAAATGGAPAAVGAIPGQPAAASSLSIIASLNLSKKTGEFRFVSRVTDPPIPPYTQVPGLAGSEILVNVQAMNGAGTVLFTYPVRARLETDIPKDKDQTALINSVIPDAREITKLVLLLDGKQVAETSVDPNEQKARLSSLSTIQLNPQNSRDFVAFLENLSEEETKEGLLLRWTDTAKGASYSIQIGLQNAPLETLALAITKKYYVIRKAVLGKYRGQKVRVVVSSNNLSRSDAVTKIVDVK